MVSSDGVIDNVSPMGEVFRKSEMSFNVEGLLMVPVRTLTRPVPPFKRFEFAGNRFIQISPRKGGAGITSSNHGDGIFQTIGIVKI